MCTPPGRGNPEKSKARRSSTSAVERPECERNETTEMPAGAQVMISTPNFYRLEIAYSEFPLLHNRRPQQIPALDIRKGFHPVRNAPGLGHEFNPHYVAAGPDSSLID